MSLVWKITDNGIKNETDTMKVMPTDKLQRKADKNIYHVTYQASTPNNTRLLWVQLDKQNGKETTTSRN